jgi:CheY-like chemotaxis protein
VDLVFSDVLMPGGMNGLQLAKQMRRRFPNVPVLLTTGFSDALAEADAKGLAVITKPYSSEDLCQRIGELMRQGRH